MKIKRYYQGIGYPSDMEEHDEYGDWVKWEDVEPLLERINELEKQKQMLEKQVKYLFLEVKKGSEK